MQQRALNSYPADLPQERGYPPDFESLLRHLVPSGSRRAIMAVLGNRASWSAICHWKKGRRRVPQWVRDRIAQESHRIALAAMALPPPIPEKGRALAAWRAEQAAKKGKAPDKGA